MPLPVVKRVYWGGVIRLASLLLVASSGVAFFYKVFRTSCQKNGWWIWRLVPPNHPKVMDQTLAMTALAAVKAASSVAAEVANLCQVMLAIQSEGKLRAMNLVRDLQSQSFRLIEAEQMMRCVMEQGYKSKQAPATDGTFNGKSYYMQLKSQEPLKSTMKASFSKSGLVSSNKGHEGSENHTDALQPSIANNTPQSRSFLEVMAMLERGETPPGIKNINDKPPIPNQLPSVSYLQPKPKPWEKAQRTKSYMFHTE